MVFIEPTLAIEKTYWDKGLAHVAGIDEVGRGCLAGPVVAAAVIFPPGVAVPEVNDSKKLSYQKRERLAKWIQEHALSVGLGLCSPEEVDQLNILHAAMEAMRRAVLDLCVSPEMLLIDGNRCFPDSPWPFQTIVKGDAKSSTIAAASIIAKTTRDVMMMELHQQFPHYGWDTNVGYPTKKHYDGLKEFGITPLHRRSFRLTK